MSWTMKRYLSALSAAVLVGLSALVTTSPAHACAVFAPPSAPIVTDHRMIISVGKGESTLYDEVRYTGAPESFAWVLPITGEATVGLSAELLFSALDARTRAVVSVPDSKCPPRPTPTGTCAEKSFSAGSAGPRDGVTVTKQQVVGPYETVQLQGSDPKALTDWLAKNGFVVPDDVKPLVATYVAEKFNFLAIKLVPGQNVKAMRPIRVTTQGANVTVPLRSISAGTGPSVKLALWVVAEGRYEPSNFASFVVAGEELVWNWSKNGSNYAELRAAKLAASRGMAWEVHSSIDVSLDDLKQEVSQPREYQPGDPNAPSDYAAVDASPGVPRKSIGEVRDEDFAALAGSRATIGTRVTFLQAELPRESLGADMILSASADQSKLASVRAVGKEIGEPKCAIYDECGEVERVVLRSEAVDAASGCSAAPTGSNAPLGVAAMLGVALVVVAHGRRRRPA